MNIDELFDVDEFKQAEADGHIRIQQHPAAELFIANYTEKAACDQVWNAVTLTCRGLVYQADGTIVARPFAKFFNHGQAGCAEIALDAPVVVTDKMDGSLGIIYKAPDGLAVATRGSFASEQAIHATKVLRERYGNFSPPAGWTVLAEIVYPENRIVVNYGDIDELILLGAVSITSGEVVGPGVIDAQCQWPGPVATTFDCQRFSDALAMSPRDNAEGIVVRCLNTGAMVKIKQEDYIRLHRIVTGLTARKVWEHLMAGLPLADLIEPLPDEFHQWVRDVANGISTSVATRNDELIDEFHSIVEQMPDEWNPANRDGRKDFARIAANHQDKWAMFALLDGRTVVNELLKRADPGPYITPTGHTHTEDAA